MQPLAPIPGSPFRALDYTAREGTYAGAFDEVRWGYIKGWLRSQVRRGLLRRRWFQVTLTTSAHVFVAWIRDEGTTGAAGLFVTELRQPKSEASVLARRAATGRPLGNLAVGPFSGRGSDGWLELDGSSFKLTRGATSTAWDLDIDWQGVRVVAELETSGAPDAATLVSEPSDRRPGLTSRWNLLPVAGAMSVNGTPIPLDGARASIDYTNGFLDPRAKWRMATGTGVLPDGRAIGFAISDGNRHGDLQERLLWIDDGVGQIDRVRILVGGRIDRDKWRLRSATGDFELKFVPHAGDVDPVSRIIGGGDIERVAGTFMGHVPSADGPVKFDGLPGLCEEHRVG